MRYINKKHIKLLVKEYGKRVGKDFLECLDRHIEHKIVKACTIHNGHKKTLDAAVAGFVGIKG